MLGLVGLVFETSLALAQGATAITPTMGAGDLGTTVTVHDHKVKITGGTRPGDGVNLFHSFDQFSVGVGDTAQFLTATPSFPTSNILSRVTGATPSTIFGTIDTTSYPSANLFLMNPAGIVFGANATLNVGGSVTFTTANYLRLAEANGSNAGIFHADPTVTSLLTNAPVAAFGFLGPNPAAIAVQSKLTVAPGKSISLVGGNQGFSSRNVSLPDGVTVVDGYLSAPDGQVNIASVASPGEILAGSLNQTSNVSGQSFGALGEVRISQSTIINNGEGGGTIFLRGGHLVIDNSTIGANTANIDLHASSIRITTTTLGTRTATAANAGHVTLGASGDITIDSSLVGSESTTSSGNAGNIEFSSEGGNISLTNSTLTSQANNISSGRSGNIKIAALNGDILLIHSNVFNRAHVTGTLGNIQINARDLFLRDESKIGGDNTSASAAPGSFTIELDGHLNLAGGSFINTGSFGSVASADLIIRAPEILITGTATDGFKSGLYTSTISSGEGGRLRLFTGNLQLTDGGILSSRSLIGDAGEIPSGRGGVISVEGLRSSGPSITIDGPGSGITASAEGTGAAGDILVKASSVTMTNNATITASSTGQADAGKIDINAGQHLDLLDNSSITTTTQSAQANGGNIDIRAVDRVRLVNNSEISTSVMGAEGSGGNIFIDPKVVVLQDSTVTAQAVGGTGGNITFVTPLFLADSASIISASSQRGVSGTVTIQSPTSNLSGTVGQLASKTNPPQVLLQNRCIALAGGEQSTFILSGRDTVPAEPGGWLSSPIAMEHWTGEVPEEHVSRLMVRSRGWNTQPLLVVSKDKTTVLSLRRLTPPGFLVRSFATGTTGCPS